MSELLSLNQVKSENFQQSDSHYSATHFAITALLNCYIREVAISNNQFKLINENHHYTIKLSIFNEEVSIKVNAQSISSQYVFLGKVYNNTKKKILNFDELVNLINEDLAFKNQSLLNFELIQQAKNSIQNIIFFIENNKYFKSYEKNIFLKSEQNLLFGHEFHPASKARFGLNLNDLAKISPEVSAKFKLEYFKIPKTFFKSYQENHHLKLPTAIKELDDAILYPLHPYQAQKILNNEKLSNVLNQHNIQYIGTLSGDFYPTSSVRTLFNENDDYFYKFSLHIRLTNCLRKNAFYELQNAVEITKILNNLNITNKNAVILNEPQAFTINLNLKHTQTNLDIQEYFGFIVRDNINKKDYQSTYLALSLFSYQDNHKANIVKLIKSIKNNYLYQKKMNNWFKIYAEFIVKTIFDYYFTGVTHFKS